VAVVSQKSVVPVCSEALLVSDELVGAPPLVAVSSVVETNGAEIDVTVGGSTFVAVSVPLVPEDEATDLASVAVATSVHDSDVIVGLTTDGIGESVTWATDEMEAVEVVTVSTTTVDGVAAASVDVLSASRAAAEVDTMPPSEMVMPSTLAAAVATALLSVLTILVVVTSTVPGELGVDRGSEESVAASSPTIF
jgi:hypothetical protein